MERLTRNYHNTNILASDAPFNPLGPFKIIDSTIYGPIADTVHVWQMNISAAIITSTSIQTRSNDKKSWTTKCKQNEKHAN